MIAGGQNPGWVQTQEWLNLVGYPARPKDMERFGIRPRRFADWAAAHRDAVPV